MGGKLRLEQGLCKDKEQRDKHESQRMAFLHASVRR